MASLADDRDAHIAAAERQKAAVAQWAKLIAAALLVALTLRSLVYEPFSIPSKSMLPGLMVGDYLFVAKWPYGYGRYSLPLAPDLFDGRRIGAALPERGDVIVFKTPRDNRTDYIKRVIGLPGDRVAMVSGVVVLNGVPVTRRPITGGDPSPTECGRQGGYRFDLFEERLGGRSYRVLDEVHAVPLDDMPEVIVPAGHVFLLGDNRDDSADSRLSVAEGGVGLVPVANIVGRADFVFLSLDPERHWVRASRIGLAL
jgi:signal peptidase I